MKIISSLLIAVFIATGAIAQQNIIDKHFDNYRGKKDVTSVHISSKMFELANYIEFDESDNEMQQIKEIMSSIEAFHLIAGRAMENPRADYTAGVSKVAKSHEELMRVDDVEGSFTFFIDESRGVVKEIVMVGTTDQEFIVFSLTGRMNLKDISQLAGKIQAEGFSHMKLLKDNGAADVKVYPNPSSPNEAINLEYPENLVGGQAIIFDMSGKTIQTFDLTDGEQQLNTKGMQNGQYVIELSNSGVSIKKNLMIQSK